MHDNILKQLACEVLQKSQTKDNREKKQLWQSVFALKPNACAVNIFFYQRVWKEEFAGDLTYRAGLEAHLEQQLRFKLWRDQHFSDDVPMLPFLYVPAKRPGCDPFTWLPGKSDSALWGVDIKLTRFDDKGSYVPQPPIKDYKDIKKIVPPDYVEETAQTDEYVRRAEELTGGLLPIVIKSDQVHWGPFEYAVWMRGLDALLYDFIDAPEFVHDLMNVITNGLIHYQQQRQAAKRVRAEASFLGHAPFDRIDPAQKESLKGCWAYIHAQSSGAISPQMYAEFVHPYNKRLASWVGKTYYHGCEDLSQKCTIISDLPGLTLFHVSPWTPEAAVAEQMDARCAFEVHAHPTGVLEYFTRDQMKEELEKRHDVFQGRPHTLALADIEQVAGRLDRLKTWVQIAKETAG